MLHSVSWSHYVTTLIVATIIYYIFLWLIVYKANLKLLPSLANLKSISMHPDDAPDEVLTSAQHIIDELRPLFPDRTNKNELILALQLQLKRYAQWDDDGFRDTINRFIVQARTTICSIRLSETDIRALWPRT